MALSHGWAVGRKETRWNPLRSQSDCLSINISGLHNFSRLNCSHICPSFGITSEGSLPLLKTRYFCTFAAGCLGDGSSSKLFHSGIVFSPEFLQVVVVLLETNCSGKLQPGSDVCPPQSYPVLAELILLFFTTWSCSLLWNWAALTWTSVLSSSFLNPHVSSCHQKGLGKNIPAPVEELLPPQCSAGACCPPSLPAEEVLLCNFHPKCWAELLFPLTDLPVQWPVHLPHQEEQLGQAGHPQPAPEALCSPGKALAARAAAGIVLNMIWEEGLNFFPPCEGFLPVLVLLLMVLQWCYFSFSAWICPRCSGHSGSAQCGMKIWGCVCWFGRTQAEPREEILPQIWILFAALYKDQLKSVIPGGPEFSNWNLTKVHSLFPSWPPNIPATATAASREHLGSSPPLCKSRSLPASEAVKHLGLFTSCEHLHSRTWTKDLYFLQVFGSHQLIDFLTCCSQWVTGAFPKLPYRMWMSFSYPSQSSLVRSNIPIRFTSLCY